jgi:hypothetical protein
MGDTASRKSAIDGTVARYIAAWNETDATRRRALVAQTWSEDGSYRDPIVGGEGHDAIAAMIGAVQERLPFYRFRLISGIDAHNGRVRYRWEAGGTAEAPLYFAGTDFAILAPDGRFASVTGFLDAMPTAV